MFKNRKGFTLIELIIVLVISIIILSSLVSHYWRKLHEGYRQTIEQTVVSLSQAITSYYEDIGKYPSQLIDLEQSSNPHWAGAYIHYKLNGNNELDLASGKIVITYTNSFSGDTDCGYLSNRPAIIVKNVANIYPKLNLQGVCKAIEGNDIYFVIP